MIARRTPLLLVGLALCAAGEARGQSAPVPFTLAEALARAGATAPRVLAAQARAVAADGIAASAGAWRAPTLDLSIENLGPQGLDHDGFVWFTQPLDVGPRRTTRLGLARAQRDLAGRDLDLQRRALDSEVVDAYLDLARSRGVVDLLAGHERALGDMVTVLRRRLDEGVVREGDVRRLEAERARAATELLRATIDMRRRSLTLSLLTGEPAATLATRVVVPGRPPLPAANLDDARDHHPEVLAAAALVDERRTAAAAERALGGTAVSILGGYKRTSGFHTGTAGVSVDLPLGGRNRPARLRAEAEVVAATAALDRLRLTVGAEISHTIETAQALAGHATGIDAAMVEPARIAWQAASAALREGTGDVVALVDAARVHLDTRREAEAVQLEAVAAAIRARLAFGEAPLP